MVGGRNAAHKQVLLDVAEDLSGRRPDLFDLDQFEADFGGSKARGLFDEDVREARFRGTLRFPSLMLRRPGAPPAFLPGWRPYQSLIASICDVAPELGPERRPEGAEDCRIYWGDVTDREISEMLGSDEIAASDFPGSSHSLGAGV